MATAAINPPSAAPYGLKAIREMKGSKSNPSQPTERLKKKVLDTQNYFYEKVDPIVGECITHLLCEQPSDVSLSMLDYFQKKARGEPIVRTDTKLQHGIEKKAKKELKLFLATSIGPVVSKLINRIALTKPDNVIEFLCTEMTTIIEESGGVVPSQETHESHQTYPYMKDSTPVNIALKSPRLNSTNESAAEASPTTKSLTELATENQSTPIAITSEQEVKPISEEESEIEVEPRNVQISVIGVGGAGKSTILNLLEGKFTRPRPTLGFRPVSMMLGDECKIRFYDLGGGKRIRDIWDQYYHDVHGVIFVVDSSSTEDELKDAAASFSSALLHPFLVDKPLLLLANKQDQDGARTVEEIVSSLNVKATLGLDGKEEQVADRLEYLPCSAFIPDDAEETDFAPDVRIEQGLEGLLSRILRQYEVLNLKVEKDSQVKATQDELKRQEKERYVLKCKIASAYKADIDLEILEQLNVIVDPESLFTEEEGVTFLAAEIGEEAAALPPIALKVAKGVGYQRLALQMIGALKAPINKKKVPSSWEDIYLLICTLRAELGLGNEWNYVIFL